jgi:hypothetical protein
MKLDRNIRGKDGKGKYALVRLRSIEPGDKAHVLLKQLEVLGVLDWGVVGDPDEFFVIKLRDKYAAPAIAAYAKAVAADANAEVDEIAYKEKVQWSLDVQKLGERAGVLSPFCKQPD